MFFLLLFVTYTLEFHNLYFFPVPVCNDRLMWYDEVCKITEIRLYRGSYMSAHVLLNLLNEFGKR